MKIHKNTKLFIFILIILFLIGMSLQILFPKKQKVPSVINFLPKETENVPIEAEILLSFDSIIPKENKEKITFSFSPKINFSKLLLNNNYQYLVKPASPFLKNTNYIIEVFYDKKSIFKQKFKTARYSAEEQNAQATEQGILDLEFNDNIEKLKLDYPWYEKIPIVTDEFVIVYDYELESFRIRLLVSKNADENVKKTLQQKALEAMKSVDIDPDEWGYHFLYSEKLTR